MDSKMMVKQFVARIRSTTGMRFNVFETADSKFYLFDQIDESGCSTLTQFPVRKADLKQPYRRALSHGWGNTD